MSSLNAEPRRPALAPRLQLVGLIAAFAAGAIVATLSCGSTQFAPMQTYMTTLSVQRPWRLRERDPRVDGAILQKIPGAPVNSLPGKTGPGLPDAFRELLSSPPYGPVDELADTEYGSRTAVERLEKEMRLNSSFDGFENPAPLTRIGFTPPARRLKLPHARELDIVIPCIRDLDFLESWRRFIEPYHIIIIQDGDPDKVLKVPEWFDYELYNRRDIDRTLGPSRAWIMSAHDSAVRAFGFLVSKAKYIYTLDDDCFPPADGSDPIAQHLRNLITPATPYFFNTLYDPYADENDFVRGYPYSLRAGVPTVISHGLWLNAPDYDAPTQLMKPKERNRRQVDAVITVPAGVLLPMCGMNVAFDRARIGPAFMLGLMGDGQPWGRYDDMIMGWTGKKCADALGFGVKSGGPYIVHNKASNPFVNLKKEYKGLEWQEHAIDFFKRLELSPAASESAQACYLETADALEATLSHLHPYFTRFAQAMRLWIGAWDDAQSGALEFVPSRESRVLGRSLSKGARKTTATPWPKAKVIVPAVFSEWEKDGYPEWAVSPKPEDFWTTFLYQRLDPSKPHYSPNFGREGAVYVRFIVEHYDALPDLTLFIQGHDVKNTTFFWLNCVRDTTQYVQLPQVYVEERNMDYWFEAFPEACWHDILEAFNISIPPRDPVNVAMECCAAFIISRDQIRSRPLSMYEDLLDLIGGPRCHRGPLDLDKLRVGNGVSAEDVKKWEAEAADPNREDREGNRFAGAMAFEHLNHVLLGGKPFIYPPESKSYCEKFLPASQCPWSPCEK